MRIPVDRSLLSDACTGLFGRGAAVFLVRSRQKEPAGSSKRTAWVPIIASGELPGAGCGCTRKCPRRAGRAGRACRALATGFLSEDQRSALTGSPRLGGDGYWCRFVEDPSPGRCSSAFGANRFSSSEEWSRRDSNPQPLRCERSALPLELRPRIPPIGPSASPV